jgi:dTDP-4-dehydrorhamnose 3,5-epimerase-like enzyme
MLGGRVRVLTLPAFGDDRGRLSPISIADIGFRPLRAFLIDNVPAGTSRGGHAHRTATQLLICLSGTVVVAVRDRHMCESATLGATEAVLIGPGVWSRQTYVEPDSRLLVLGDEEYDPASYLAEPLPP